MIICTLNTFNDNIQNDNLESVINDELLKINKSLNIARFKYMTFQRRNNKCTDVYTEDR